MSDCKNRTIEAALLNAERIKKEYPHYIQPDASDRDMVLMLEQIQTLTEALAAKEKEVEQLHQAIDDAWEVVNKSDFFNREIVLTILEIHQE